MSHKSYKSYAVMSYSEAMEPIKAYRLVITVTLKATTGKYSVSSRIEYSGLAYGDDSAAEITYSTLCHARNKFNQRAVITAGNVEFGPVYMGIMPEEGE